MLVEILLEDFSKGESTISLGYVPHLNHPYYQEFLLGVQLESLVLQFVSIGSGSTLRGS